jgi:anaerobic dimethyl sulfoxide reductase subunit C (anchor subunit)/Tat-targeted selenate reductase subunit YnfH
MAAHLPLVLFTTLASIGAGCFIAMACALAIGKFDTAVSRKFNLFGLIPLIVTIVGFICSMFDLGDISHAIAVLNGIGRSGLSNEILVGGIFVLLTLIYVIYTIAAKAEGGARKGFAIVNGVIGLIFLIFMGVAYWIQTIAVGSSFFAPVEMIGLGLTGGVCLCGCMAAAAGAFKDNPKLATLVNVANIIGALLAIIGALALAAITPSGFGAVAGFVIIGVILLVVDVIAAFMGAKKGNVGLFAVAVIAALIGVFLIRLCFYVDIPF